MKQYLRFEYLYIILIIIWEPFQKFVLKSDGSGKSVMILTLVFLMLSVNKKSFYHLAFKKPISIWGIWVIYAIIIALIKGYSYDLPESTFFMLLIIPYLLMIILNLMAVKDYKRLINVLIIAMYINVILVLFFNTGEGIDGRFGGDMNSNTIGIMSTILLMYLYLKYIHSKTSTVFLSLLAIIPVYTLIISGSKTAFGGFLLLVLSHFLINRTKNTFYNLFKITFLFLLLSIPLYFIINNTQLGERILSSTEEGEKLEVETGNAFLDKFGDRGIFYYIGWQVFKDNPITGVGLGNYVYFNEDAQVQHTEYMIQLSELGIIGVVLFISFYFSVIKGILGIKQDNKNRKKKELSLAFIVIILVMLTSTRMFFVWYMWSVVGVVTGYVKKEKLSLKHYI